MGISKSYSPRKAVVVDALVTGTVEGQGRVLVAYVTTTGLLNHKLSVRRGYGCMIAKICGVRSLDAAKEAAEHNADFVGVILVPNRKRTVDHVVAAEISQYLRAQPGTERPRLVGVFRNQTLAEIKELQSKIGLDVVQLHGSEPAEWIEEIEGPVIRKLSPGSPGFVADAVRLSQMPDTFVLVDSEQGGDGKVVDWSPLSEVASAGGKYILAGGLTPENVRSAAVQPGCVGVDVSGGVETETGDKDFAKIRAFLENAKR